MYINYYMIILSVVLYAITQNKRCTDKTKSHSEILKLFKMNYFKQLHSLITTLQKF